MCECCISCRHIIHREVLRLQPMLQFHSLLIYTFVISFDAVPICKETPCFNDWLRKYRWEANEIATLVVTWELHHGWYAGKKYNTRTFKVYILMTLHAPFFYYVQGYDFTCCSIPRYKEAHVSFKFGKFIHFLLLYCEFLTLHIHNDSTNKKSWCSKSQAIDHVYSAYVQISV
jgi:hypothetical protein